MLPRTFYLALQGFYEYNDYLQKGYWNRMRIQTTLLLQPKMKKGRRLKPQDLIKLPWDEKDKQVTEENAKETEKMTRDILFKWGELDKPEDLKLSKIKNKKK